MFEMTDWEADWFSWADTEAGREALARAMYYPDMPTLLRAAYTAGWADGAGRVNRGVAAVLESERGVR